MAVENSITDDVAKIKAASDDASDDRFDIGHAAALLLMLGNHISNPGADRSDLEWQGLGNHVEYLGQQIQRHCESSGSALEDIEAAARRLRVGAAA